MTVGHDASARNAAASHMPEVIVVGAWNTADRMRPYLPWHRSPLHARFLIEKPMPEVSLELRTRTGPRHSTVMAS